MKEIYVFGTGIALEHCLTQSILEQVCAFVDNDAKKWGNKFHSRKIISLGELRTRDPHRIYIATAKY